MSNLTTNTKLRSRHTGGLYSQSEIAHAIYGVMTRYVGVQGHTEAEECQLYNDVADDTDLPARFVQSMAHSVGAFIDPDHDAKLFEKEWTAEECMDAAYALIDEADPEDVLRS